MARRFRTARDTATGRLLSAYREGGDERARTRLVELYMPLVEALAHRHDRRGAEHDDLVQAGSIGLLNAIERFDTKRGEEFVAFAVPTVAGEMKRHLRDRVSTVRLPRRLHEAGMRVPAAREQLTAQLGRAPSADELAAELGVTHQDLARLQSTTGKPVDRVTEAGSSEQDASDARLALSGAFRTLDETDRTILYLRFVEERSRREVATELGMSQSALARRADGALAKVRSELEGRAFEEAPAAAAAPGQAAQVVRLEPSPAGTPGPGAEPVRSRGGHSGRLMLRMPQSLHAELAEAAEREEVSLNQFITNTLAASMGWHVEGGEPPGARPAPETPGWLPAALVTNIVVVVIAGLVALALLIVALTQAL
ncbi:MAG TPA: sigma-70 family RNA polymerase sigma factor [Thermoleophilaceae bacterium]